MHDFNRTILREYDVRGIVGSTLHPADATALGRSFAALATSEGAKRVAVGETPTATSDSLVIKSKPPRPVDSPRASR